MAKYAISLKIDVSKIDKEKLFKGTKGTYLDAVAFIDTETETQYGDHGMITQSVTKEEKDKGVKGAILGNGKIIWRDEGSASTAAPQAPAVAPAGDGLDEDIPFADPYRGSFSLIV